MIIQFDTDEQLVEYLKKLPADYWDFRDDDTHGYTHGIHSYPAMMVSPISKNIIDIVKQFKQVDSLFDPFAGSGTVLVEGMLADIPIIAGNDINPLALLLSKVKTTPIDRTELQNEYIELKNCLDTLYHKYDFLIHFVDDYMVKIKGLDLTAKDGWGCDAPIYLDEFYQEYQLPLKAPTFKNIGYWFRPRVIFELTLIKNAIAETSNKDIRDFFSVAMSEMIRLVSNRRNGEFKMFRMTPEKVAKFNPDTKQEFIKILERNIDKMSDFTDAYDYLSVAPQVTIFREDACKLESVPTDTYDLIVTSPPYGDSRTTVAYGEYSRLSMQWLDIFELTEKEIMGVDRTLMGGRKYRNGFEYTVKSTVLRDILDRIKDIDLERAGDVFSFYNDLEQSIAAIAEKTKKDGYQFWVVANRTVKGEVIPTDKIIEEIAQNYGLQYVYTIDRNIVNKVMPSANSPTNEVGKTSSTMTVEHIVVLRKL
ncbi:MAG: DNA methylase [Ruminococcaceae bacterium]|nr:DNA methylase [Oscillospiraceae bacterium]